MLTQIQIHAPYRLTVKVFFVASLLIVAGCHHISLPEGHYEGTLLQKKNSLIEEQSIRAELSRGRHHTGQVEIINSKNEVILTLKVSAISSEGFDLDIPEILDQTVHLEIDQGCFVSESHPQIQLCFSGDRFLFEILNADQSPLLTLSGDRFGRETEFSMESPQNYLLSDAIALALEKNFDSKIQFEHLIQSKLVARASYLNLLPHISLSTVLNAAFSGMSGLLSSIGDLAPFLLPTRWFQAGEAALRSEVERDALFLMQADLATQLEGLNYTLERDRQITFQYEFLLRRTILARAQVNLLESQGQLAEGSTDHVDTLIDSMTLDLSGLKLLIGLDKAALSQVLGMHNPQAVNSMEIGNERVPIDQASLLESEPTSKIALSRSFEIRQINSLIQISGFQKKELYFNWLDPSGDPSANLGFGLGDLVAASQSRIHELEIKREQLQALVVQKVYESVAAYDASIQDYRLAQKNLALQERRLIRVLEQIKPASGLSTLDLQSIIQDYLASAIRKESMLASFRIARSKIDRFLLQGYYHQNFSKPHSIALR